MKHWFVLIGITLLAFFLRFYQVARIPPSLSWDEVSIGYNAYSILKTGRDEHGRFLPLNTFVAFGDYKPPIPIYLTVPFVAILGLNELAVRLPSVIAGTFTVLLTYFLVKELFGKSLLTSHLSLITALLLAISPWHIQLSRAGFEANIALGEIILGAFMMLRSRSAPRLLLVGFLPFVAAIYTFNSARYFSPLVLVGLLFYGWSSFRAYRRQVGLGLLIAFLFLLPILPHLASREARLRFAEVNIFTDESVVRAANARIGFDGFNWWAKLVHNRRWGYLRSYLIHFLDHFQPSFLFIRGDGNPKFSLQDIGQLYLVELPFLILGIFFLAQKYRQKFYLLLFWLLAAIAPAAVARETPHALRIENSLPTWQIFIAAALVSNIKYQISRNKRALFIAFCLLLFAGNFAYFWHNYFNHYASAYSGEWQYGYREAIREIAPLKDQYPVIYLSEAIGRPYIYVAFYEQLDPWVFRGAVKGGFDAAGFYNVASLGKYRFVRSDVDKFLPHSLYILPPNEVPATVKVISTIKLLNGSPALVIFANP
ncbi:MAG: phospholipid carrier-dependent glycosyltransferase [Patescibacteria group bacterium]